MTPSFSPDRLNSDVSTAHIQRGAILRNKNGLWRVGRFDKTGEKAKLHIYPISDNFDLFVRSYSIHQLANDYELVEPAPQPVVEVIVSGLGSLLAIPLAALFLVFLLVGAILAGVSDLVRFVKQSPERKRVLLVLAATAGAWGVVAWLTRGWWV